MFCFPRKSPGHCCYQEWPESVESKMGYWSFTTCQSPGNEDPITNGRWSSWQKVAVKLLNCSLLVNVVGITEVNALVGAMF